MLLFSKLNYILPVIGPQFSLIYSIIDIVLGIPGNLIFFTDSVITFSNQIQLT